MPTDSYGHKYDDDGRPVIEWTPTKLAELKRLHAAAVKDNRQTFQFEGLDFDRDFAMYLIQYLDPKLRPL